MFVFQKTTKKKKENPKNQSSSSFPGRFTSPSNLLPRNSRIPLLETRNVPLFRLFEDLIPNLKSTLGAAFSGFPWRALTTQYSTTAASALVQLDISSTAPQTAALSFPLLAPRLRRIPASIIIPSLFRRRSSRLIRLKSLLNLRRFSWRPRL